MEAQDRPSFSLHSGHCRHSPVSGSSIFYDDVSTDGPPWREVVEGLISPHPTPTRHPLLIPPGISSSSWPHKSSLAQDDGVLRAGIPKSNSPWLSQAQKRRRTLWNFRVFFAGIWELKWGEGGAPGCLSSEVSPKAPTVRDTEKWTGLSTSHWMGNPQVLLWNN